MKQSLTLLGAALVAAASLPALAQNKPAATAAVMTASAPGTGTIAMSVTVTSTVTAIDKATRAVTLKGPEGKLNTVTAGADVRNFDQIKVGDSVTVKYVEALTLTLKKDGKDLRGMTETPAAVRAPAGERPAGAVGRQVEVTANVIALDAKTQTVTLKGPKQTVDLKVPDAGQFKLIKVGDQIQATFVEAVALAVEPAKK
ncbi:MAG: hypothetical protein KA151_00585 [Piscinibacter sp.]|nr:hypothetical protein [Piscinibacter sp.]